MKKFFLPLVILFSAFFELHAQTETFKVDYELSGANASGNYYYLTGPGSFSVNSLAANFCATSTIKWTVHPKAGATISNPDVEEPTVKFTSPGTYSLTMTVKTYSAPGWTCGTETKYAIKYISVPKPAATKPPAKTPTTKTPPAKTPTTKTPPAKTPTKPAPNYVKPRVKEL